MMLPTPAGRPVSGAAPRASSPLLEDVAAWTSTFPDPARPYLGPSAPACSPLPPPRHPKGQLMPPMAEGGTDGPFRGLSSALLGGGGPLPGRVHVCLRQVKETPTGQTKKTLNELYNVSCKSCYGNIVTNINLKNSFYKPNTPYIISMFKFFCSPSYTLLW